MSFSYDAKMEVVESEFPTTKAACYAELGGMLRTCCQINTVENGFLITGSSELKSLPKRIAILLKKIYEKEFSLTVTQEERPNHSIRYNFIFPDEIIDDLLEQTYMIRQNYDGQKELFYGVSRHLLEDEDSLKAFVKGVFIGCASANIVIKDIHDLKKHTGGYHLEFVFLYPNLAGDFSHVLSEFNIFSRTMQRRKFTVIYIKEAEVVSDVLALVGANQAVLTLQNEFAVREVRNKLNRQLNCMNGNLNKMVEASLKQIDAIEYISNTIGLDSLSDNLYELCMLRLANPEENLENLALLMNPPLTKSGINHRLRKIVKLAEELKAKEQNNN